MANASKGRITAAQLGHLLDTIADLEKMFEAIKKSAKERAHAGELIPGWEKDFTTPHRAWEDEDEANTVLAALGLDKRARYTINLLSPAQAEEALKKAGKWPKRKRGSAEADFSDPFNGLLATREGNPTIKRKTA
jgi:hypothetical protein